MLPPKPDLCIYHGHCPDGFTAAWAIWKRWGDEVEFRHGSYGTPRPSDERLRGKHVLLVDFSYKASVLIDIAALAASVTILDHHESAERDLRDLLADGIVLGKFDMEQSGCGMAWEYAHPGVPAPWLIRYVEDRDIWRWSYGDKSKNFCAWLDVQEKDFGAYDAVEFVTQTQSGRDDIDEKGELLVRRNAMNCRSIIATGLHYVRIDGYIVPVCNAPHLYASEIGNILTERPEAPFGATFMINKDGYTVWSLRSLDSKVDVGKLAAEKFGGGGHRNASGFRIAPGEAPFERVIPLDPV